MARAARALVAISIAALGCARDAAPPPYSLAVSVGTYDDGSGRLGVSALATIRDAGGAGPGEPWSLAIARDGAPLGGTAAYAPAATWAVEAWPEVAPSPGAYAVLASGGGATLVAEAALGGTPALPLPSPALSLDGSRLEWAAVPGAGAYACTASSGASVGLQRVSSSVGCDVSALPAGGYEASIQALSSDPSALSGGASPVLPARFDVSEARLGLLRRATGAPLALRAAGGRIDYGLVPGLALWVSLAAPDGTPGGGDWSIEVTGPDLPASDPLRFDLPANFARRMVWAYDLPPTPGLYTLVARSGAESVATRFAIAPPASLPLPQNVSAQGQLGGGARVAWDAVPGARSYLVAAWIGSTFLVGQWVTGTSTRFADGTFAPGFTYDVYVTATDADMSGAVPVTCVSASENTYTPASFVAQ